MIIILDKFSFNSEQYLAGGIVEKMQIVKKRKLFQKQMAVPVYQLVINLRIRTGIQSYNINGSVEEINNLYKSMLAQFRGDQYISLNSPKEKSPSDASSKK